LRQSFVTAAFSVTALLVAALLFAAPEELGQTGQS